MTRIPNSPQKVNTLSPEHADHLARFKIPPELLAAAGVHSGDDSAVREFLGIGGHWRGEDLGGIIFPYFDPLTGNRAGARVRIDRPTATVPKYLMEESCKHLFFPPNVANLLTDPTVPAVIVEAEKSALALWALCDRMGMKLLPIAAGGCWGFKRKTGKKLLPDGGTEPETGPSPDLDLVAWTRRAVIIAYDSNVATNDDVRRARGSLEKNLAGRGAAVLYAEIPSTDNINGPDDLIAERGDEAMRSVLDAAKPPSSEQLGLNLPAITVRVGEIPSAVDEAESALCAHAERLGIFQRAGELVRVVRLPKDREDGGLKRPAGTVQLIPLDPLYLRKTLESIAHFQRYAGKDGQGKPVFRRIDCPARIPATYCAEVGEWKLHPLIGLVTAPIMRGDGTILTKRGYDPATGLYLVSEEDWPKVIDNPNKGDAEAMLELLLSPFKEFPFVTEADKSAHIACILTALQRPLLGACPLFAFSAPTMRSGKSMLARSAAILATGQSAPASAMSNDREEIRKAILSALREGHTIVNLDNVDGVLASPDLARAITEDTYTDRILGESKKPSYPTNVLWCCTGNNVTFRGDLTARVLVCRIDAQMERPEERPFEIKNLPDYLRQHRKELVTAAITILRAYHVAGRPDQKLPTWGGFEEWSDLIRSALTWTGMPDPYATRDRVIDDDPELEATAAALNELFEKFEAEPFTLKDVREEATARRRADDGKLGELKNPNLYDAIAGVAGSRKDKIDAWHLGAWAKRWQDRIVGEFRLCAAKNRKRTQWTVEKLEPKTAEAPFTQEKRGSRGSRGSNPGDHETKDEKSI